MALSSSSLSRIVGGIETLSAMESVPTGEKDRPQVRAICMETSIVY
jgi:hypothetical protein